MLRSLQYQQASVTLQCGDLLLAFTDGISEAMNPLVEEWREERLMATAQECVGLTAAETFERLVKAADAFAAGAEQHDDMTLLVVRVV